jgi:hypothetical protein
MNLKISMPIFYAQKMNLQTATAWGNTGVLISNALSNQTSPKNCSNGNGGSIFAFQDRRNIYFDIYASQIKRNGTFTNIVNNANQNSISLFPNPATTELFIRDKNNLLKYKHTLDVAARRLIYTTATINNKSAHPSTSNEVRNLANSFKQ